jgi:hypothetical protein
VERDKWQAPESTRDPDGFYMVVVSSVYGGFRRKRLGGVGGVWGRHCALSAGKQTVASVAEGSGWDTCEFRQGAVGFRPGPVGGELEGAGRRWLRVPGSMPCR